MKQLLALALVLSLPALGQPDGGSDAPTVVTLELIEVRSGFLTDARGGAHEVGEGLYMNRAANELSAQNRRALVVENRELKKLTLADYAKAAGVGFIVGALSVLVIRELAR